MYYPLYQSKVTWINGNDPFLIHFKRKSHLNDQKMISQKKVSQNADSITLPLTRTLKASSQKNHGRKNKNCLDCLEAH